jgi:hypothetical protein
MSMSHLPELTRVAAPDRPKTPRCYPAAAAAGLARLPSAILDSQRAIVYLSIMLQDSGRAGGLIEPCLPSPAKAPPSGPGWLHEIKHDGRDAKGVRLYTQNGNDFTKRFPLVVAAVNNGEAKPVQAIPAACRQT